MDTYMGNNTRLSACLSLDNYRVNYRVWLVCFFIIFFVCGLWISIDVDIELVFPIRLSPFTIQFCAHKLQSTN